MSETTKRIESSKVKTHQIMEIVAKSMFGLNNCDCVYYQKMVNRCAKKVLEYHKTHLHQEVIRGKKECADELEEGLHKTGEIEDVAYVAIDLIKKWRE